MRHGVPKEMVELVLEREAKTTGDGSAPHQPFVLQAFASDVASLPGATASITGPGKCAGTPIKNSADGTAIVKTIPRPTQAFFAIRKQSRSPVH